MNYPFVSIIIPTLNEEKHISSCLDSLLASSYPIERLEILVIDGESNDKTRELVLQKIKTNPLIRLLSNPHKTTPYALNIGIKAAKGEIIMRIDAHTTYQKDYITRCVENLNTYNADNAGGIIKTMPGAERFAAFAIALTLSHPFGVGNSPFRTPQQSQREADTVPFGCFKREVFEKVGLFNENLARSQDMEFNIRLKRAGGKIVLDPSIVSYYYAPSTIIHFIRHTFSDGVWATYPTKFTKQFLKLRHYIPLFFMASLLGALILTFISARFALLFAIILVPYFLLNLAAACHVALREKDARYILIMPLFFTLFHLCYGAGSIVGMIKLLLPSCE